MVETLKTYNDGFQSMYYQPIQFCIEEFIDS